MLIFSVVIGCRIKYWPALSFLFPSPETIIFKVSPLPHSLRVFKVVTQIVLLSRADSWQ